MAAVEGRTDVALTNLALPPLLRLVPFSFQSLCFLNSFSFAGDLFDWDPDAPESPSSGPLPANPFPAPTLATSPRATTFTPSVPSGSLTTGSNPRLPPQRGTAVPPRVTAPVRGAAPLRGQLPLRVSTPIPIPGNQMKKSTSDDKIAESPPIPIPGPQATNASFLRPPASTVNAAREEYALLFLEGNVTILVMR